MNIEKGLGDGWGGAREEPMQHRDADVCPVRYAMHCNPHLSHFPICVYENTQWWLSLASGLCALCLQFEFYSNENQMSQIVQRIRQQC